MKKRVMFLLPSLLLLLVMMSSTFGDSLDDFGQADRSARIEPVYQVGMMVSYRLDDLNNYDYVPSVGGQFYYFFHPMIALRAGFSHNSLTRLSREVSYHSFVGDVALRVNTNQSRVVPYLETGFSFPYVWGVNRGYEYTDFQPGAQIGVGLSFRVSKTLALDLSVNQIINRWSTSVDAVMAPGFIEVAPCPLGVDCPPMRSEPTGAFNPALLELVFRLGL